MFSSIYSIFTSKNPNNFWFKILIVLIICLSIILISKRFNISPYYEGFVQKEKFVLKTENNIYDDFYVEIYDQLQKTNERIAYEVKKMIEFTEPDENSVFLDVGCGTGHLVNTLQNLEYTVFGIDKSADMIKYAETKFPTININHDDINDTMLYETNTFTHIICDNFTIYELDDKTKFLKNCRNWLVPNGYLILHLVDKKKFNPIIPLGNPVILDNPQKYAKTRITDTFINFIDFNYKGSYDFNNSDKNVVCLKETFTDILTSNVRQNEIKLKMENIDDILKLCSNCGFIVNKKFDMKQCNGDEYQYIYILQESLRDQMPHRIPSQNIRPLLAGRWS